MGYIKGNDRNQFTFMPERRDDFIEENNAIRVIDMFRYGSIRLYENKDS